MAEAAMAALEKRLGLPPGAFAAGAAHLSEVHRTQGGGVDIPPTKLINPFHTMPLPEAQLATKEAMKKYVVGICDDAILANALVQRVMGQYTQLHDNNFPTTLHDPHALSRDDLTRKTLLDAVDNRASTEMAFATGCCTSTLCPQALFMQLYAEAVALAVAHSCKLSLMHADAVAVALAARSAANGP
jgi:hypothetical protein